VAKHGRDVAGLHAALGLPAEVFDFVERKILVAYDGRSSVVLFEALVFDEALAAEVGGHGGFGVGRGVLDVRPVHVLACEFEVGLDGLGGIARAADNESSDNQHVVLVEIFDGLEGGVTGLLAVRARGVFGRSLKEHEVALQDVFDA
jgi:hypothetical protein